MTDALKKIETLKSLFLPEKATAAVFYSEAVYDGIELYDIYAVDGDKTALLTAACSLYNDEFFGSALKEAADETEKRSCAFGRYIFGSKGDFKKRGIFIPEAVSKTDFSEYVILFAAFDGEFAGVLLFRAKLLNEAKGAVEFFNENGVKTVLVGKEAMLHNIGRRLCVNETRRAILRIEREKVLQEVGKSDKIIVIESADDIERRASEMFCDFKKRKGRKSFAFCTAVLALFCMFFAFSPWLVAFAVMNTAAFMLYCLISLRRTFFSLPDITEEEKMFGKVSYTMHVGGMSCAHCSARVKSTLEEIRGVSASVSLEEKVARIKCPASLDVSKLSEAVSGAGFKVVSIEKV